MSMQMHPTATVTGLDSFETEKEKERTSSWHLPLFWLCGPIHAHHLVLCGCADALQGAVYHNRMINVGVLNNKLFFRSLDLIKMFSGAAEEVGESEASSTAPYCG